MLVAVHTENACAQPAAAGMRLGTAAGGTSVRYHRDRAIPTTTAAQNGLLGQRYGMRLEPGPRACTQSTFGLVMLRNCVGVRA